MAVCRGLAGGHAGARACSLLGLRGACRTRRGRRLGELEEGKGAGASGAFSWRRAEARGGPWQAGGGKGAPACAPRLCLLAEVEDGSAPDGLGQPSGADGPGGPEGKGVSFSFFYFFFFLSICFALMFKYQSIL